MSILIGTAPSATKAEVLDTVLTPVAGSTTTPTTVKTVVLENHAVNAAYKIIGQMTFAGGSGTATFQLRFVNGANNTDITITKSGLGGFTYGIMIEVFPVSATQIGYLSTIYTSTGVNWNASQSQDYGVITCAGSGTWLAQTQMLIQLARGTSGNNTLTGASIQQINS